MNRDLEVVGEVENEETGDGSWDRGKVTQEKDLTTEIKNLNKISEADLYNSSMADCFVFLCSPPPPFRLLITDRQ